MYIIFQSRWINFRCQVEIIFIIKKKTSSFNFYNIYLLVLFSCHAKNAIVIMVWMDTMGYQGATVEMVLKARRAWQAVLGHVVSKARRAWKATPGHAVLKEKLDQEAQILTPETGSSVRGKTVLVVILVLSRYVNYLIRSSNFLFFKRFNQNLVLHVASAATETFHS